MSLDLLMDKPITYSCLSSNQAAFFFHQAKRQHRPMISIVFMCPHLALFLGSTLSLSVPSHVASLVHLLQLDTVF